MLTLCRMHALSHIQAIEESFNKKYSEAAQAWNPDEEYDVSQKTPLYSRLQSLQEVSMLSSAPTQLTSHSNGSCVARRSVARSKTSSFPSSCLLRSA